MGWYIYGQISFLKETQDNRLTRILPFLQAGLSLAKPAVSGNVSENQDQPSPISVLEPLYEEDDNIKAESSNNADKHGKF